MTEKTYQNEDAVAKALHPDIESYGQADRELAILDARRACAVLEPEIARLRRALQRIADLPKPNVLTRPLKRLPQQIAIAALRHKPRGPLPLNRGLK